MSFRLNAVDKANASIKAITKYDPANFEDNWAVLHLVRRAYSNKYNYYTKLVKEGYVFCFVSKELVLTP